MRLAPRLREVSLSATLAIKAEAERLREAGIAVIDLGPGEPDFDTPEHIKQEALRALEENFTHYTLTSGISTLRRALAERYARRYGSDWTEQEVVVACGAKNVLFALSQALFSSGDDVAVYSPYWVSFPDQIRLSGARPVFVPTREEDGFTPRASALAEHLTPAAKGVILNTPCNPSGATIPQTELREIARIAKERDLAVICDEVYEAFTYDGENHASMASFASEIRDRLVVVSAFSKSYAMTGWRVGYAIGASDIIKAAIKILSHDSSQAPSFSQRAALAALQGPQEPLAAMRAEYERRRNFMCSAIASIQGMRCSRPPGAFYLFPSVRDLYGPLGAESSTEVANYLLREARCATVPGEAFGCDGHLRLSYANSLENLREGMLRIGEAVGFLRGR